MTRNRKILHIDMDAFYASIEMRDNPKLRGKPVIVGGSPQSRGVVCTASYEARAFGVHSAMPCSQAFRLCPAGIFIPPRLGAYREASQIIRQIFQSVTPLVEPLSLDEAYLDVSENSLGEPSGTRVAQYIRQRIFAETGLTASAGVASNKFLAKLASDMDKPDGLTVISPDRVDQILPPLPVRKIFGIGKATESRLHRHGFLTIGDLRNAPLEQLIRLFGRQGKWYHDLAWGRDNRPVQVHHRRKSLGAERTFSKDYRDLGALHLKLSDIVDEVIRRLGGSEFQGKTVTVKVTYHNFQRVSRSQTVGVQKWNAPDLLALAQKLLAQTEAGKRPIRLLGVSISNPPDPRDTLQLPLPFMKRTHMQSNQPRL